MIHLLQLLCPERHALMAVAWDPECGHKLEDIKRQLEDYMKKQGYEHRCGLCGSTDVKFEDGITKFETLDTAAGPLATEALAQALTRICVEAKRQVERRNLNN